MGKQVYSLTGNWSVRSVDGLYTTDVEVPGSLMEALERDGHLGKGGLFYRENNRLALDILSRDFIFTKTFSLDPSFTEAGGAARTFLEADGLDTLASLTINGKSLGKTRNMHRRYNFPVDGLLQPGSNTLEICFSDTIQYIREAQKRRRLWHAYWEKPEYAAQGFNHIRKSHCSFGWDWGPIVPDVGIWRDIRLVKYDSFRLGTPELRQEHTENLVELKLTVPVDLWTLENIHLDISLETQEKPGTQVESLHVSLPIQKTVPFLKPIQGIAQGVLKIENPRLWWPSGLGKQNLYTLHIALCTDKGEELDRLSLDLGLRKFVLMRERDQWGESFTFKINGLPFFARGANWIPQDVFLSRPSREDTERLIQDAVAANFNCLRIWGGGIYPSDHFYKLCDTYGLVVWQDLMFACALYDVDNPDFLANIREEVADNLKRIRHHPSLGLICGNNEMEWGFLIWDIPHTHRNRTEYLKQYQFELAEVVNETAPEQPYWPASPSSGGDFDDPNDPDRGDAHFWEVWHGNKDFKEYERHYFRFVSEFGFESFPHIKTIESFTEEGDRNIFSPVMEDHQRCGEGNLKILSYLSKNFRFPKDLSSLVYLSQLSQAEAIRHGVEHWRRNRGRCMGSLYWQYNDNWPVASWSSVDYYGRWKALHYTVKRCYAGVLLSCPMKGAEIELHLSNETPTFVSGRIFWSLVNLEGKVLESGETDAKSDPFSSKCINTLDFTRHLHGNAKRERLFFYRFLGAMDGKVESGGAISFVPPKALALLNPELSIRSLASSGEGEQRAFKVSISSKVPALFVELDSREGDMIFSDNFFHLQGREEKIITIERSLPQGIDPTSHIFLRSLKENY